MQIQPKRVKKSFYESLEDLFFVCQKRKADCFTNTVTKFQMLEKKENIVSTTIKK